MLDFLTEACVFTLHVLACPGDWANHSDELLSHMAELETVYVSLG